MAGRNTELIPQNHRTPPHQETVPVYSPAPPTAGQLAKIGGYWTGAAVVGVLVVSLRGATWATKHVLVVGGRVFTWLDRQTARLQRAYENGVLDTRPRTTVQDLRQIGTEPDTGQSGQTGHKYTIHIDNRDGGQIIFNNH